VWVLTNDQMVLTNDQMVLTNDQMVLTNGQKHTHNIEMINSFNRHIINSSSNLINGFY